MEQNPPIENRVYLNPNFGKTHINPNFLRSKPPESIHVNPNFLPKLKPPQPNQVPVPQQGKIISKSRTKLIRAPTDKPAPKIQPPVPGTCVSVVPNGTPNPLIKIGNRKLIRAPLITDVTRIQRPVVLKKPLGVTAVSRVGKYKVDRRSPRTKERKPLRKGFVGKYALSRVAEKELLSPKRVVRTSRRVCRLEKTLKAGKLLLNINGTLYKSSRTKLEKADGKPPNSGQTTKPSSTQHKLGERVVFVRGDKFILDKGGRKLTRAKSDGAEHFALKRIDIGGLTYVADSQDTFVRTNNHKTRNYLSTTKQKSISYLSKRMTKSNMPCQIFRKVGKCAAHESGRCPKVHDKKQVVICPKFLKGECMADKCLLSHDASLSKMPTCKFFLLGCCTRTECPYLHKKLNERTEICLDFVRGFCKLAEKCDKRHEFICPTFASTGECAKTRCPYSHKKFDTGKFSEKSCSRSAREPRLEIREKVLPPSPPTEDRGPTNHEKLSEGKNASRYFEDRRKRRRVVPPGVSNDEDSPSKQPENTLISQKRHKLGDLPAFIPL